MYEKGHQNYYRGKTIGSEEFLRVLKSVLSGEKSMKKMSEELGISNITLRKWLRLAVENIDSSGILHVENLKFIQD